MTDRPTLTTSEVKKRIQTLDPTGSLRVNVSVKNGMAALVWLGLDPPYRDEALREFEYIKHHYKVVEG